ncbi:MAG: S8 family serine peptidase, partial [Anaerolineae bacterium]
FDGRLLPNLAAPGVNIISTENRVVTAGGATNLSCATSPGNSTQHSYCSGTSMSTPHVTGAAALFFEFWRLRFGGADPYPETVKAAFINATDNLAGGDNGWGTALGNRPDNHQGWGRLNMGLVLNPTVAVQYYQNPTVLTSAGSIWERTIRPNDSGEPLRVSLVWSDAPGAANANPARVNNLDLRVTSAGGTIWRGNVFSGGWSTTGGSADSLNNVENVFVQTPSSGSYTIRVTATALNGDGYYYNGDTTDQHFSLVCWNCEEILDGAYDAGADEAMAFVGLDGAACTCATIVSAISAASSGATIYISPGTYPERLGLIDKDLVLTAATNDCGAGATSGVTVDANDAVATYGGVAQIGAGRSVTLANLTLTDGTATLGGIVYVGSGAHLVLDNTDLSSGSASSLGGGLRIYGGTAELINTSRILGSETTVSNGGGAALDGGTLILRDDSRIGDYLQSNTSAGLGGGVYLDGAFDAGADEAMAFVGLDGAACAYATIVSAISAASSGATIY